MTVVEIVDGDTITVEFGNGETEDVRLLGVDTAEVHTETNPTEWEGIPDSESGRDHLRDWGHRAGEFARTELELGESVRVVVDETADRRGYFDRLLVYLYDDGELFNRQLLERGYARLYDTEFSERSSFAGIEESARTNDVGVWNFDAATPTPTVTPTDTPDPDPSASDDLVVGEIRADAPGDDHENLNEEYIVFGNVGDETIDLGGWRVVDEADHDYVFPPDFELAPGESVTLHTGSGQDSATDLYWGSGRAVWNNGGDTIFVYDENGDLVIERSYD